MKYFMRGRYKGRDILGSGVTLMREYATDKNAINYMRKTANSWLNGEMVGLIPDEVYLFRYTNFYDDTTFKRVYIYT